MVKGLTSNSAASVLNVLLLAAIIVLIGHPVVAVGILLMTTMAAMAWWGTRIAEDARLPIRAFPAAVVGLLLVNPILISTIGLETYLGIALVVGVARYALAGRPTSTGVITGLVALARPDLIVFASVIILGLRPGRRRLGRSAVTAVAWTLAGYALSGWVLGWGGCEGRVRGGVARCDFRVGGDRCDCVLYRGGLRGHEFPCGAPGDH